MAIFGKFCPETKDSCLRFNINSPTVAVSVFPAVGDYAFEMVHSTVRFGEGVTAELGADLVNIRAANTLVVTDPNMRSLPAFKLLSLSALRNSDVMLGMRAGGQLYSKSSLRPFRGLAWGRRFGCQGDKLIPKD